MASNPDHDHEADQGHEHEPLPDYAVVVATGAARDAYHFDPNCRALRVADADTRTWHIATARRSVLEPCDYCATLE